MRTAAYKADVASWEYIKSQEECYGIHKDIKEDEIEAEFTDGTLKLVIPKQEKVDTKKSIEIK